MKTGFPTFSFPLTWKLLSEEEKSFSVHSINLERMPPPPGKKVDILLNSNVFDSARKEAAKITQQRSPVSLSQKKIRRNFQILISYFQCPSSIKFNLLAYFYVLVARKFEIIIHMICFTDF